MDEGLKTSLYLDERPVFIHDVQDAPDQAVIAQIKNELPPVAETLAESGKKHTRKKLRVGGHTSVHMYEMACSYNGERTSAS